MKNKHLETMKEIVDTLMSINEKLEHIYLEEESNESSPYLDTLNISINNSEGAIKRLNSIILNEI